MRRLLGLVLIGAATAGCLTLMPVSSHVQRGVDFTRFRTYDWGPADARPASDARLVNNPYFVDDLHGSIDTELLARGLVRATNERADLLVHYHASVVGRVEGPIRPERLPECADGNCPPVLSEYEAGTLVIDVMDARTHRVVWRGWIEHRLEDMLDEPARVRIRIREAVHRVMDRFPLEVIE